MPMPETTMNKYNFTFSGESNIWLTREIFSMKSVSVPHTVDHFTNHHLRASVFAFNLPHNAAAEVTIF